MKNIWNKILIKILNNKKGSLLVESLLSASILSAITLILMGYFYNANSLKARFLSAMEFQEVRFMTKTALSNQVICDAVFKGKEIKLVPGTTNAIDAFKKIEFNGHTIVPNPKNQTLITPPEFFVSNLRGPIDYNGTKKIYRMNIWISSEGKEEAGLTQDFRKNLPLVLVVETATSPAVIEGCLTEECL